MKQEIIKKLINIWDPLGVYGLAPKDEYDDLAEKILELIKTNVSEIELKNYLLQQYYNEDSQNSQKVDELYDLIMLID